MRAKMKDMGKKMENGMMTQPMKTEISYPKLNVNSDQVKGLSDLKLGDKVYLTAECTIDNLEMGKDYGTKEGARGTLCIKKASVEVGEKKKSPKSIEDAEHEAMEEYK